MPLPKNSANTMKIEIPTPITIPVKGWEIGQSLPSLAQLEIKIKRNEVKINSVNNVELILIDFSILISFNNNELVNLKKALEQLETESEPHSNVWLLKKTYKSVSN